MKIEVGMYVRTKYGIGKVDEIRNVLGEYEIHLDCNKGKIHNVTNNTYWNHTEDIIGEPSLTLIDLIEIGDYVNGMKVLDIKDGYFFTMQEFGVKGIFRNEDIKTIVTKEQFERESYKLGDD